MGDREIIRLFLARSEQAVAEAQEQYGKAMLRFAARFLSSDEDCEECVNEALFKAWSSIPPNMPQDLRAYLLRLVRCTALDLVDKQKAAKRSAELVSLTAELEECIPDKAQHFSHESSSLSEAIEGFLAALPKEKRAVFVKRYWYGESVRMISAETGFSESKIKTMLMRIRKKLKDHIERLGENNERK